MQEADIIKQKVQKWIVSISVLLLLGKFTAYFLTNSVGILTDAMESIVNVVAGFISLYSLKAAAKPKDKNHPFGHGKIELLSASIEGLLIIFAGALIIFEGARRFFEPAEIQKLDIGIVVIAVAGVINYILGWYSIHIGKKHDSIALIAGGKHLQSDTYSTIGLVIGLLLLYFTKLPWIDSALALIFGSIILITGISILKKTTATLMDKADNEVLEGMVKSISKNRKDHWIDIHNTKIIKYGSYLYIDCDVTLPWYYNIVQGHEACVELRDAINVDFPEKIQLSVHSDPCNALHCEHCLIVECYSRKQEFAAIEEFTLEKITESDEERGEYTDVGGIPPSYASVC